MKGICPCLFRKCSTADMALLGTGSGNTLSAIYGLEFAQWRGEGKCFGSPYPPRVVHLVDTEIDPGSWASAMNSSADRDIPSAAVQHGHFFSLADIDPGSMSEC